MKYEIVKENSIVVIDKTLYQIRALKDFNNIEAGDLGGWICEDVELSHDDNSWIYPSAMFTSGSVVGDSIVNCYGIYNNVNIIKSIIEGSGRFESLYGDNYVFMSAANVRVDGNIIIRNGTSLSVCGKLDIYSNSELTLDGDITFGLIGHDNNNICFDGVFLLDDKTVIAEGSFIS